MGEDSNKGTAGFWANVRANVETKTSGVAQEVTDHYVKKEIDSRVEKTIAAIDKLSALEGQWKKIKPDQEQYDGDGKLVSSTYSKAKLEERKKLAEKIERFETALLEVFEKGDFKKLKELNLEGGEKSDAPA